jgi:SAM-dependent methyltransferase
VSIGVQVLALIQWVSCHCVCADDLNPQGSNTYQLVTGEDSGGDQLHWDHLFNTKNYIYGKEPSAFLKAALKWFKGRKGAKVLDLAMGEGRNAVFLAKNGFEVDGVDISEVALRKAKRLAHENGVSITTILADLTHYKVKKDSYAVILNFDYLQRSLIPQIKQGLKRHGMIIYENDTAAQGMHGSQWPAPVKHKENLLNPGELKELFSDFEILSYVEIQNGGNSKAQLVAQKP